MALAQDPQDMVELGPRSVTGWGPPLRGRPAHLMPPEHRPSRSLRGRPWLAVQFRCCSVYTRIYRNIEGTAYAGRCPKCGRPVHVRVGNHGTNCRFFEAS